jgi:catechol 2,3-dioxygenase-like lactoylglutathione lyase family enzyme
MTDGPGSRGLHHVALHVFELERCRDFYVDVLGMHVEWQPDEDTVFLTSGTDNLALTRIAEPLAEEGQRLDHLGFVLDTMDDVDRYHDRMVERGVPIVKPPKTHRDGGRSFMCQDPDGTVIQVMYHPPLSGS